MEHALAIKRAAAEVHGLDALDGVAVEAAGRTDLAIARDLLLAAGVGPEAIDAAASEVAARAVATYDELCPADMRPRLAPGIVELLDELTARPDAFRLSLVTGNLEPGARLKLARAGIGHHFPAGRGGFRSHPPP